LSVIIDRRYPQAQVDAFCDALKLFKLGYSWGGPMSLVVPYDLATLRSVWPKQLKAGTLVRFSIGLEAAADLQADLAQALQELA
jgi:cystathionine beta-lyase